MKKIYSLILSLFLIWTYTQEVRSELIENSVWYTIQSSSGYYVSNGASSTNGTKISLTLDAMYVPFLSPS